MLPRSILTALLILIAGATAALSQEVVNGLQLTTLKAPWVMRIPRQSLDIAGVQVKPDLQSGYFMMVSEATHLNVSVFIEPVSKCSTAVACRDMVLAAGNP